MVNCRQKYALVFAIIYKGHTYLTASIPCKYRWKFLASMTYHLRETLQIVYSMIPKIPPTHYDATLAISNKRKHTNKSLLFHLKECYLCNYLTIIQRPFLLCSLLSHNNLLAHSVYELYRFLFAFKLPSSCHSQMLASLIFCETHITKYR